MDLFLTVHLQKQYLLITLLINLLILFKWTLLERSLRSLLRSLVIKSLIDNIFIERLGFSLLCFCPRLFLYKWWEQMAEIEINDFFSLLGNTMYIIKRLTVPTSGYRGLAHLAECSGHIKNPGHIKRGWYIYICLKEGACILFFLS